MKNLISAALLSLIIFGIASCSKTSCTDHTAPNYGSSGACTDLTANMVGTYSGTFDDSIIGSPGVYSTGQTITITKIDDSQVQFTPSNTSSFYAFTATLTSSGGNILLTIPSQTSGGANVIGYSVGGSFNTSTRQFSSAIVITASGSTSFEGFSGIHQ